jgi:hypothetical protein
MDISKIEKLLSKLAKNGDKETIKDVVELLTEITKYEGKQTRREPAPVVEDVQNASSRASMILEGNFTNAYMPRQTPLDIPYNPPSQHNPYGQETRYAPTNPNEMINKPDVRNHADSILW